ncbi:universal stress protein [Oleiharenicola lentus]|uniref:Universal stress protein n=1 Tax=Oleiharenicola lentus TaxID=2508720 RepID=A0A4Q1CCD9_9BACT|nr:universal stress protein [Oleiharenicola lentus]RXK56793.1 universal stress protein [Oleiharenicola lentus]
MSAAKTTSVLGGVRASYPRLLRILVPLDFSGKSRQALRYAVPLAQKFSARIHLVHVLPDPGKTPKDEVTRQRTVALKRLGEMSLSLLPPRVRAENAVLTGKPAEQILALAGQQTIDLIVLTTKGRSGLKRVLVGSTAEEIMRHAPCPVMSVRRQ